MMELKTEPDGITLLFVTLNEQDPGEVMTDTGLTIQAESCSECRQELKVTLLERQPRAGAKC